MTQYRDVSETPYLSDEEKARIHSGNVVEWSPLNKLSYEEKLQAARKFGPNWASILSGLGDQ